MILLSLLGIVFLVIILILTGVVLTLVGFYKIFEMEDAVLIEIGVDIFDTRLYTEDKFSYEKFDKK